MDVNCDVSCCLAEIIVRKWRLVESIEGFMEACTLYLWLITVNLQRSSLFFVSAHAGPSWAYFTHFLGL